MSSISGASGPSVASAGGAGRLPRNVRMATAAAPRTRAAAISPIARSDGVNRERRLERLRIGGERRVRGTRPGEPATRRRKKVQCLLPRRLMADYQSNLTPKRHSRGGTIVVGCRKFVAEPQLMFWAAFVFVRL